MAACGGDDGSNSNPDGGIVPDAGAAPRFAAPPRFDFQISESRNSDGESELYDGSSVIGTAFEQDPTLFQSEAMRSGECRLLSFTPANCTPFCDGICASENVCEPFPTFASVGALSITGLREQVPLTEFDGRYSPANTPATDLFDPLADIELTAAGGSGIAGFSLVARGVEPMVSNIGHFLTLEDGGDLDVSWTPAGGSDRVRLVLRSANAAHGMPLNHIVECDSPDDGSIAIPQAMVEILPNTFPSLFCVSVDCPPSELSRYTVGEATVDGSSAQLVVEHKLTFPLSHNASSAQSR